MEYQEIEPLLRQLWLKSWGERYGGWDVTMSNNVHGLARLLATLPKVNSSADAMADRLSAAFERVNTAMATTATVVDQVEGAAGALEAINAQFTNGGPPLAGSSTPPAATSAPAPTPAVQAGNSPPTAQTGMPNPPVTAQAAPIGFIDHSQTPKSLRWTE
jgi:hypothetical protein